MLTQVADDRFHLSLADLSCFEELIGEGNPGSGFLEPEQTAAGLFEAGSAQGDHQGDTAAQVVFGG
jgi:hypothetical protein